MIGKIDKNSIREKRHERIRNKFSGTAECPRLAVFRSSKHIYAQIIDDVQGITLVSASTLDKDVIAKIAESNKTDSAKIVGETIGKRAVEKGIAAVVFDRGGYVYTGRVQALADGARSAGLQF